MTQAPPKVMPKKRKFTNRMHVGSNTTNSYCKKWALDVIPSKYTDVQRSVIENKCLPIAFLLAFFQNIFFKSGDPKYTVLSQLGSRIKHKRNAAIEMLSTELQILFNVTKLQVIGPYQLQSTIEILSNTYKCQIYVFSGITNTKKLLLKYPSEFNDQLMPVFLFQSATESNHIIFIKNLNII